jgi:hypothetical protein
MTWSGKKLRPFRENRLAALKNYVGRHFSDAGGATSKQPINMIWLAISIYQRHLVPQQPSALVRTRFPDLKPAAAELELALNHLLNEIDYHQTCKMALIEAMFSIGIVKIGLESQAKDDELGFLHDTGQPFADCVLLDDWMMDMAAPNYEQCTFSGNKYRVPFDYAKENKDFDEQARSRLNPRQKSQFSLHGGGGEHSSQSLTQGNDSFTDEYMDMVELWDIWLPRQGLFVTMESGDSSGPPLMVREWSGPEHGPYHLLRFQPVPGTPMPIAPVMQWFDMNEAVNRMWSKLIRQGERQKEVLMAQSASSKDAENVRDANDGEIIHVQNPQGINSARLGGIDQNTHAFSLNARNMLGYLMGNLDAIGGLSAQSSTLGQDQMLSQSANRMIDDMRQEVSKFHKNVFMDLARYLWEDPFTEMPLVKRVGENIEIPFVWTDEQKEGDFEQYNLDIEPYSMRSTTPEERLAKLTQMITEIVIPMGMQVDQQKFASVMSHYANLPELEEVLSIVTTDQPTGTPSPEAEKKITGAAKTTERISRAGPATRENQEQMEMQAMMSAAGGSGQGQQGPLIK